MEFGIMEADDESIIGKTAAQLAAEQAEALAAPALRRLDCAIPSQPAAAVHT
jgi:hypothetical protein